MNLERRVEALERENRRLKIIVGAALGALAVATLAGAIMPQEVPEEIEARLFRVVDENGDALAELSAYQSGSRLVMIDRSGRWRVAVGAVDSGPQIRLHDSERDVEIWRAPR